MSTEQKMQMRTNCWECEKESEQITAVVAVPIAADRFFPPLIPRSEYSA
jgi:hypothetical protein